MAIRNPRTDPRKGDVLKKGKTTRTITSRVDICVEVNNRWIWLESWIKWAKGSTILKSNRPSDGNY